MTDVKVQPYGTQGRTKKLYRYVCPKCGKEFWVDSRTYKRKLETGENCQSCLRSVQCKRMIDKRFKNMSAEEKTEMMNKLYEGAKRYRDNLTDDEKKRLSDIHSKAASEEMKLRWKDSKYRKKRSKQVSEQMIREWGNRSKDKRYKIMSKLHAGRDKYFAEGDDSVRREKLSLALTGKPNVYWANLSEQERADRIKKFLNDVKFKRENMTEDERLEYTKKLSDAQKRFWLTVSDEDRKDRAKFLKRTHRDWWDSVSDDYKRGFKELHSRLSKEYINSLSAEERYRLHQKNVIAAQGENKLHMKFISMCHDAIPNYELQSEYITTNNGINHSWDYALFLKDELIMLIDLDGEFYHADKCDYDGAHSQLKYDKYRGLSIPDKIKHCIIREKFIDDDFKWLLSILPKTFDEYVDAESRLLANMPFPIPVYTDIELLNSWDHLAREDLSTRYPYDENRFGDRIIQHFSHSLYDEKIWTAEWIHNAVENHIIYHHHMHHNKILQPIIPNYISAYEVRHIIRQNGYSHIFDPYSNMSIMLGAISAGISYSTLPIDEQHYVELISVLDFLSKYEVCFDVRFESNNKYHNIKEDIDEDQVF